ncbi:MAG: orotate phosphoribosyltransferase [Nitrospirae bacterium]|nr:MAG: orotate phosphoribosyltransferase [Nitrospirota bacterium]
MRATMSNSSHPHRTVEYQTLKDHLIQAFSTYEAFKWDPRHGFPLASGATSPFYVDCRALLAHPHPRRLVAQLAFERIRTLSFQAIGGLELGAIPLALAISDFGFSADPPHVWRTFVVRKQAKGHGLGKRLEGLIHRGDRVLIVDDVLTSGHSLCQAIVAARDAELHVDHALVIVDRQEHEGRAQVEAQGVQVISLLTLDDLQPLTHQSAV